jgi:hypothetical protein
MNYFAFDYGMHYSTFVKGFVTDYGVIKHWPDLGHWGLGSNLLFKGLRN